MCLFPLFYMARCHIQSEKKIQNVYFSSHKHSHKHMLKTEEKVVKGTKKVFLEESKSSCLLVQRWFTVPRVPNLVNGIFVSFYMYVCKYATLLQIY